MSKNYTQRIQGDNRFRFWISILAFVVSALFLAHNEPIAILATILVFLVYTLIYGLGHLISRARRVGAWLHYILIASDAVAITGVIYLTGGMTSPLYFLYLVLFGVTVYHRSVPDFVYATVLCITLYAGILFWTAPQDGSALTAIMAQIFLLATLTGVLYVLVLMMLREEAKRIKLVSRARTLSTVSDILCGSLSNSRDWIKHISKIIEEEIYTDGLQCRIVISRGDQQFLPPSGGKPEAHFPIMVGEWIFGTIIVTWLKNEPLSGTDQDFFSSVAKSLGLSLHRSKLWEEFHQKLEEMEGKLPGAKRSPKPRFDVETPIVTESSVESMIEAVKTERQR